jgi:hypothetical protein
MSDGRTLEADVGGSREVWLQFIQHANGDQLMAALTALGETGC